MHDKLYAYKYIQLTYCICYYIDKWMHIYCRNKSKSYGLDNTSTNLSMALGNGIQQREVEQIVNR